MMYNAYQFGKFRKRKTLLRRNMISLNYLFNVILHSALKSVLFRFCGINLLYNKKNKWNKVYRVKMNTYY